MDRTPPPDVRRTLREEVGYGCPVDHCGSPYLSWHHFDPPWSEREHHDTDGMIALCKQHHDAADGGAYTKAQLQRLKSAPYLLTTTHSNLRGRFEWRRERLVLHAAAGVYVGCECLLSIHDRPVIWLSRDADGYETLNLDIWSADGTPIVSMRENDWIVAPGAGDIECPAQGRSLLIRAPINDARLSVQFRNVTRDGLRQLLERDDAKQQERINRRLQSDITKARRAGHEWKAKAIEESLRAPSVVSARIESILDAAASDDSVFTICDLTAKLPWPIPVHITASRILLPRGNVISGLTVVGGNTAIALH